VLEKIGEGGMGSVYRARDTRLDRVVALKFLTPARVDSPVERQRMLDEARALSTLSHPNVATVYEVDEVDNAPFLALEYLSGGTLRARIAAAQGHLPVPQLLRWAGDFAEGLAHAHRHGIVHRDVKSSNVMFDGENRLKLTDFGLARTADDEPSRGDAVAGTLGYIAPEQLQGKCADFQSDLFSLGVVLYEAATGRMPFQAESAGEAIREVLTADPVPVTALRPELPAAFGAIVERLLRKRPEDRFQSAAEVAQKIRDLAWPPTSVTATLPVAVWRAPRRWWIVTALACLISLGWIGGGWAKRWVRSWGLPARKHVAVLPFRSIGGDAGQQAFCDGLTETVTTALTRLGGFSVVPSTDARRLEDADAARREFGVNLVIAGTVQRRGDAVRVVIHLIDAAQRRQIGSEPLDLPEKQLFELENGVLGKMADLLNVFSWQQPPNLLATAASQLPNAHDGYLRGRGFLYRYDRAGNLEQAIREFETAVRQDPRFALAHVGLAEVYFRQYSPLRDPAILQAARLAAERSLELNPQLASAHTWHGRILAESGQQDEAVKELQTAVRLDPSDPAGYRELARVYQMQARPVDAERVFKQAIDARPGDWIACSDLASFYNSRQRYLESETQYRKVLELTPDNPYGYRNLAAVLIRLGKNREAEGMLRKALELRPLARTYSNLGALLMFQGRYADAVPAMEKAAEIGLRETPREYRIWGNLGDAYWLAKLPPEKAQIAWRRAVEIAELQLTGKPGDAELMSLLAKYHSKLGDRANALRRIADAVRLAPSNATVHYQSGLALALLGDRARALAELTAAAGLKYSIEEIRQAPELATLHESPDFQKLISPSR
jgi:serine/threonine-protein kinase